MVHKTPIPFSSSRVRMTIKVHRRPGGCGLFTKKEEQKTNTCKETRTLRVLWLHPVAGLGSRNSFFFLRWLNLQFNHSLCVCSMWIYILAIHFSWTKHPFRYCHLLLVLLFEAVKMVPGTIMYRNMQYVPRTLYQQFVGLVPLFLKGWK